MRHNTTTVSNARTRTDSIVTKLGTAKGAERSRVWIEGVRLVASGFVVGASYDLTKHADHWNLKLSRGGRRRVSGKGDSPIIDVTGKAVNDFFGGGSTVLVLFGNGVITFYPMA